MALLERRDFIQVLIQESVLSGPQQLLWSGGTVLVMLLGAGIKFRKHLFVCLFFQLPKQTSYFLDWSLICLPLQLDHKTRIDTSEIAHAKLSRYSLSILFLFSCRSLKQLHEVKAQKILSQLRIHAWTRRGQMPRSRQVLWLPCHFVGRIDRPIIIRKNDPTKHPDKLTRLILQIPVNSPEKAYTSA